MAETSARQFADVMLSAAVRRTSTEAAARETWVDVLSELQADIKENGQSTETDPDITAPKRRSSAHDKHGDQSAEARLPFSNCLISSHILSQ